QLGFERVIAPVVGELLRESGSREIVDLCSGACGPVVPLCRELSKSGTDVRVTVTDKYPNRTAFARAEAACHGGLRGWPESVDATSVPRELNGVRTLFNAFHHFQPELARRMIRDACDKRQPMAIFEITHRSLSRALITFIGSFLIMFALVPRMRPRRAVWWLGTYVIPILPLAFGWDGMVSCLRTYTEEDYRKLTAGLAPDYQWRWGRERIPGTPLSIEWFTAAPARVAAERPKKDQAVQDIGVLTTS